MSEQEFPHSLPLERSLLSSILLADNCVTVLDEVSLTTRPEHFYSPTHRSIYEACLQLRDTAKLDVFDVVMVGQRMEQNKTLADAGGIDGVMRVMALEPHAGHAAYYARKIRDLWMRRRIILLGREIAEKSYGCEDADEVGAFAERRLSELTVDSTKGQVRYPKEIMADIRADRVLREQGIRVECPTGFSNLDELLNGGLSGNQLVVIAARPSCGKTGLACNMIDTVASSGRTVLMFSLEQRDKEIIGRILSARCGVSMHATRLTGDQYHEQRIAEEQIENLLIGVADNAGLTISQICAISRSQHRKSKLSLIVVDYLQLVKVDASLKDHGREQHVANVSRQLKLLTKELDVPVIALCQLNRDADNTERPKMSQIRESGQIEADSDVVMLIHKPRVEDDVIDVPVTLIVDKNRNGPTGDVELMFHKPTMRFTAAKQYTNITDNPFQTFHGDDRGF